MARGCRGALAELRRIGAVVGTPLDTCAWSGFYDPDVSEVLAAYDWLESGQALAEWWGPNPPYWLVLGVQHYRRCLRRAKREAAQSAPQAQPATLPPGFASEFSGKA